VPAFVAGIALLFCIIAALMWPPHCRPGNRIALGEALFLDDCGGPRRLESSKY
jgi:hypothetical protein